jgi:hypothetical protein
LWSPCIMHRWHEIAPFMRVMRSLRAGAARR